MSVEPGDLTVQTGAAVGIEVTLTGRTDRDVVIRTRELDPDNPSAGWMTQNMLADSAADSGPRVASFGVGAGRD